MVTIRFVDLVDPNDLDALQFAYDFGDGFVPGTANEPIPGSLSAGSHVIRGRIDDGTVTQEFQTTFVINDLPPALSSDIGENVTVVVAEGSSTSIHGYFINPGGATPRFGASLGSVTWDISNGTWTWTHTPTDNASSEQPVTITIIDDEGSRDQLSFGLFIENIAPKIGSDSDFIVPMGVREGDPVQVRLTNLTDPSATDTQSGFRYHYDFGDGRGFVVGTANQTVPSALVADSGRYVIRARVSDKDGEFSEYARVLKVANTLASLDSISVTPQQISSSALVFVSGTFSGDAGIHHKHTTEIDWGDGSVDRISEANLFSLTAGGSGYASDVGVPLSGGSGSEMTVDIGTRDGVVVAAKVANRGTGYQTGDVLTIVAGGRNARLTLGAFNQSAGTFTAVHSYAHGDDVLANPTQIVVTVSDDDGGQNADSSRTFSTEIIGAPTITSPSKVTVFDQQTMVMDNEATAPNGDVEGNGLTYRLIGGVDVDQFSIVADSGLLTFKIAPDAIVLADAGSNNVYHHGVGQ